MQIESLKINLRNETISVSGKTTRTELIQTLGNPDDIGGFSKKKKRGEVLKYEDIEFHFSGDKDSDNLTLIYRDRIIAGESVIVLSIPLT